MILWFYDCREVLLRPGWRQGTCLHSLGNSVAKLLGSLWACMNWDFQESSSLYSVQIFRGVTGVAQTAEQPPHYFEACASQTAVPSLVLVLVICLQGISTPFMGCRLRTHTCKFPAKSLCLVPPEECPDQSDWDITHLMVCFWLSPILAAPQTFLISPPVQDASSFIQHLTSWCGRFSGTLGKGMGVGGLCRQRSLSGWQRCWGTRGSLPRMHRALFSLL